MTKVEEWCAEHGVDPDTLVSDEELFGNRLADDRFDKQYARRRKIADKVKAKLDELMQDPELVGEENHYIGGVVKTVVGNYNFYK